jgi:hypothetical protein
MNFDIEKVKNLDDAIPAELEHYNARLAEAVELKIKAFKKQLEFKQSDLKAILSLSIIGSDNVPIDAKIVEIGRFTQELALLSVESSQQGCTIAQWQKFVGGNNLIGVVSEFVHYFSSQLNIKYHLNDLQKVQVATAIVANNPHLRLRELMLILNNGITGKYGPNYSSIDINTISQWIGLHYEQVAIHYETINTGTSPEGSRGVADWDIAERKMKLYQKDINERATILAEANERAKKVAAEKAKLLNG